MFIVQARLFKLRDLFRVWKLSINKEILFFKPEFSNLVVQNLWKNTKYHLNISKIMPARPRKHRDMGLNTTLEE